MKGEILHSRNMNVMLIIKHYNVMIRILLKIAVRFRK